MKKYKLTKNEKLVFGRILHQIKAIKDFSDVKKGELGGWIEKEMNLSQDGNCWCFHKHHYIYILKYIHNNRRKIK